MSYDLQSQLRCVIAVAQPISGIPAGLKIQGTRAVLCYYAVSYCVLPKITS